MRFLYGLMKEGSACLIKIHHQVIAVQTQPGDFRVFEADLFQVL